MVLYPQARAALADMLAEAGPLEMDDPQFDPEVDRRTDRVAALAVTERVALEVDTTTIPGVGDSSGANLIAGLCIRDPKAVALPILLDPPVDASSTTASMRTQDQALTARDMRWF